MHWTTVLSRVMPSTEASRQVLGAYVEVGRPRKLTYNVRLSEIY